MLTGIAPGPCDPGHAEYTKLPARVESGPPIVVTQGGFRCRPTPLRCRLLFMGKIDAHPSFLFEDVNASRHVYDAQKLVGRSAHCFQRSSQKQRPADWYSYYVSRVLSTPTATRRMLEDHLCGSSPSRNGPGRAKRRPRWRLSARGQEPVCGKQRCERAVGCERPIANTWHAILFDGIAHGRTRARIRVKEAGAERVFRLSRVALFFMRHGKGVRKGGIISEILSDESTSHRTHGRPTGWSGTNIRDEYTLKRTNAHCSR